MAVPSGTVTFLSTDIEGSTRLWDRAPEAMRAALHRHDAIMRTAIEAQGGYVFSTGGDGFAAAYTRAGDAVRTSSADQWTHGSKSSYPTADVGAPAHLDEIIEITRSALADVCGGTIRDFV